MKQAQGLPLNMVVLALIALLVIVVVFAYFTGVFGKVFKQTAALQETMQGEVTSAQTKCAQYCISIQNSAKEVSDWETSDFCTEPFEIDADGDGKDETYYCHQSPISQSCTVTIGDAEYSKCTQ